VYFAPDYLKIDRTSHISLSLTLGDPMFRILFLLFIVVPIIEIALLIQVSDVIGGFATIALVIVTAIIGAKCVKQQGLGAYTNVQQQMAQGQLPGEHIFTGLCVIIAGVLLMTPGIMTDVLGFLLLTPAVRRSLSKALLAQASVKVQTGFGGGFGAGFGQSGQQNNPFEQQANRPFEDAQSRQQERNVDGSNTFEGEYKRKD
jgi:UPF0716 protein FxsA